jgi:hypothetical protein
MPLTNVDRTAHGKQLLRSLRDVLPVLEERKRERERSQLETSPGIILEFESFAGFELALSRLDSSKGDIQLLNVRYAHDKTYATCFIPDGKLTTLTKKINAYVTENNPRSNEPKNQELAASIQSIGVAAIEALWTDSGNMPVLDAALWWEIWLRADGLSPANAFNRFHAAAKAFGIHLAQQRLVFPERIVVHIHSTKEQLASSFVLLNMIAEIRRADEPLTVPTNLKLAEQDDIVNALEGWIDAEATDVSVAIFDTGIFRTHPLIEPALSADDMHTVDPLWNRADHDGHGTRMAGLALYGCLYEAAAQPQQIRISYKLESVKILSPAALVGAGAVNEHEVLGRVVAQAVSRCEIAAPNRRRVICKAVTTKPRDNGEPSAYSAAIDQLAYGYAAEEGNATQEGRLFAISAGNVQPDDAWLTFPASNHRYSIEQPAQAWNVMTVGAYTNKDALPATPDYAGWQTLATRGELSPFSSTSNGWSRYWPVKPEVLFEGGNVAVDPSATITDQPNTLQMLTTSRGGSARPTIGFNMTSAATALAARLSARIMSTYPTVWAETVRGLVVHHADWTDIQKHRYLTDNRQETKLHLLRTCGYGIPDQDRAINSVRNGVTMMVQDSLQPYKIVKSAGKMNEMRLFELPWPQEQLLELGNTPVKLKITLSYFVEPSPGKRGWANKYRYASHGLRFALRRNNESAMEFNERINHALLDDEEDLIEGPQDTGWFLGANLQTLGSIHSDTWSGFASDLATRNLLAVYPVMGWWRQRPRLGKCTNRARFSLVISLEIPNTDIDLYQYIEQRLELPPIDLGDLDLDAGELELA